MCMQVELIDRVVAIESQEISPETRGLAVETITRALDAIARVAGSNQQPEVLMGMALRC